MHAWYSVGVDSVWDAGVSNIIFWLVMEECLYSKFMGRKDLEKMFTACIAARNAMWSNNVFVSTVGAHTYAGIYVCNDATSDA